MESLDPLDRPIPRRASSAVVPLTYSQRRAWNYWMGRGGPISVRMCASSVSVIGALDVSLFRSCLAGVVERHESLRTRIVQLDGNPQQCIDRQTPEHFNVVDLASVPAKHAELEIKRLAQQFAEQTVELSIGPLFAVRLFRRSDHEHTLILALDHIVSDDISNRILVRELWTLYRQATQRQPFALADLPIQFADYAVWQQRSRDAWLRKHESYWKRRLEGTGPLRMPLHRELAGQEHREVATQHTPLGKILTDKLRDLARRESTTLPLVFLTAYVAVIARWCKQNDFIVAFASHGRHGRPELENVIGFLASILHLRMELAPQDSFLSLLDRIKHEFSCACAHQDFGAVALDAPQCSAPLYFNWIGTNWPRRSSPQPPPGADGLKLQPFPMPPQSNMLVASQRLRAVASETAAGIVMTSWYRPNVFERDTLEQLGHALRHFAGELAREPQTQIRSVSFRL